MQQSIPAKALVNSNAPILQGKDDILEALFYMNQCPKYYNPTEMITGFVDKVRILVLMSAMTKLNEINWPSQYVLVGGSTIQLLNGNFNPERFVELLLHKHAAYGPLPIRSWGNIGVAIRIDAKIQRFFTLQKNPEIGVGDESLIDTLTDIVGYCVLGYWYSKRSQNVSTDLQQAD